MGAGWFGEEIEVSEWDRRELVRQQMIQIDRDVPIPAIGIPIPVDGIPISDRPSESISSSGFFKISHSLEFRFL